MRLCVPVLLVLLLTTSLPSVAHAQDRTLLRAGVVARITRGGIWPPDTSDFRDTTIAFYPSVRFFSVALTLEHGGEITLYEALDPAGQLYLFDSPASFRLLHAKYFRGVVDSSTAATIALLAARFGGQLPGKYSLGGVRGWLIESTLGGGRRLPYAWEMTIDAEVDGEQRSIVFEVGAQDGLPRLMTRKCEDWCYTTILEP